MYKTSSASRLILPLGSNIPKTLWIHENNNGLFIWW